MRNDAFSSRHPAVSFAFFFAVVILSAFLRHPACVVISFICALVYALYLDRRAAIRLLLLFCLPLFVLTSLINPAFNHRGTVTLAVLPSGNSLTLESTVYGAFAALLLCAVIIWFFVFSRIISSDKFLWLAGRTFPALALLFSMTIRFVPELIESIRMTGDAQRALRPNEKVERSVFHRVKSAFSSFSSSLSRSLENSIITADSMKSRGYGLGKRSSYSYFRFTSADAVTLSLIVFLFLGTVAGSAAGAFDWHYYPAMGGASFQTETVVFEGVYLLLCILPLAFDGREAVKWRFLA
jgi:energy-coupling factor transport system permease protein